MSDEMFALAIWCLVAGMVLFQCMASDACRFDAYGTCLRNAADPAECEGLLPREWRR